LGTRDHTIARLEAELADLRGSCSDWICARCGARSTGAMPARCVGCGAGPVKARHAVERQWAQIRESALRGALAAVSALASAGLEPDSGQSKAWLMSIKALCDLALSAPNTDRIIKTHAALHGVADAARWLVTQWHPDGCECRVCGALALVDTVRRSDR